jgi:hypothetical protein
VSVCVPLIVARQRLGKQVPATTNTHNNIRVFDASFSARSVLYQKRVCGSVCISKILVYVPPKRWSEGSQGRQRVKHGHESRETWNQESLCWRGLTANCWTVHPHIFARQLLGNHVPAQQIVEGVVFCAVRVVSKESRRLVLLRTSCLFLLVTFYISVFWLWQSIIW